MNIGSAECRYTGLNVLMITNIRVFFFFHISLTHGYLQNNNEIIIFLMVEIKLLIQLIMWKVNITALPPSIDNVEG